MHLVSFRVSEEEKLLLQEIVQRENVLAVKRGEPPRATASTVLRDFINHRAKELKIHVDVPKQENTRKKGSTRG